MLCVVGDLVEDVVVRLTGPPERGSDRAAVITRRRGGSGANVAVAAAAAGCAVQFIGRVGDDALGTQLVDALVGAGVQARVQRGSRRTGSIVVLVEPDGERTMFPDRAAAAELAAVDEAWLDGVDWLHVPAYSLCAEPIGSTTLTLAAQVRAVGGAVSVDVSSVAVVREFGVAAFAELLAELAPEVVFANGEEATLVQGKALDLLVLKHGSRPVELVPRVGPIEHVPVPSLGAVVDTTGAGDAFAGGYLAAVQRGLDPSAAAAAGADAAAGVLRALAATE